MLLALSTGLLVAAGIGLAALCLQWLCVVRHLRELPTAEPAELPPFSILKPLCGVDDDLEANLRCFAQLDYPHYELLLGVRDAQDRAFPLALEAARRWPERVRVVLQRGEPGFNPKVNQLVTLEQAARYDLLVVSDSNTRVAQGYLRELATHFARPEVACVTHPVAGGGERSVGSMLDNLHLGSGIGPGQVGAKRVAGKDLVIGKSMALRRQDLAALGGFVTFKDYLAEDYVIGCAVTARLGKQVVVAHQPVVNHSRHKSVGEFFRRYVRWGVLQRTGVDASTYAAQGLLNPVPLAVLAWAVQPSAALGLTALLMLVAKAVVDVGVAGALRGERLSVWAYLAVPLKDALLFAAWLNGFFQDTVNWRGNALRVLPGSRLVPLHPPAATASTAHP